MENKEINLLSWNIHHGSDINDIYNLDKIIERLRVWVIEFKVEVILL
jgi:hypothetical protein